MTEQRFCPYYPPPAADRPSVWRMFFSKRRSWLDGLYQRSYRMKMGEVHLPGLDLYMVNEPPLVRHVMEDAEAFPKHALLAEALRPLLGDSIFTTNGEQWRHQRELLNPAFEGTRVQRVFGRMRDAADALIDRWKLRVPAGASGAEMDVEVEMTHVAADTILRTILSRPLESDEAQRIFHAFCRYQVLAPRLMLPAVFGLRWLKPWWQARQSRRCADEIRSLLAELIRPRFERARAEQASSEAVSSGAPGSPNVSVTEDILDSLLSIHDPSTGKRFEFDELVDQIAMLFLAGHETSASALAWALHLLAHAPQVQERLYEEACRVLPRLETEGSDALRDLTLARDVFRETLRLFPPVGFLAREAAEPAVLRDKQVARGATVVVSPWLIQRHRDLWARPDEFDPDRFHAEDASHCPHDEPGVRDSLRKAYLPFGMGPRVCIGATFALQEAVLVLASLARQFRFTPVIGKVPEPVGRLTIRAEHGIHLQISAR